MTEKRKSMLTGVLFAAFGIFITIQGLGIKPRMRNDMGSGYFPVVVGIAIIIFSVFRFITAVRMPRQESETKKKSDMPGGWLTIVLVFIYVFTFNSIGFLISTAVFLFLQMLILTPAEKRSILLISFMSIIVPLVVYTMFVYALNIPLPKGIFGF